MLPNPLDELARERDERKRLELLLESTPSLFMALDRQGIITYINWVLPQHDKTKVIGSQFLDYFEPDKRPGMRARLESVLASGEPSIYESVVPGPDGNSIWFSSRMAPVQRGGQTTGVIIVSENTTAKKRVEIELEATRHMAVLGTLVAGVAHEINTPVQFLGDSVTFLREATDDLLKLIGTIQGVRMSLAGNRPEALESAVPAAIDAAALAEQAADLPYLRERMPQAFDRCVEGLDRVTTIVRSLKAFAHPSGEGMEPADLNQAIGNTLIIAKNEYKYFADVETSLGSLPPVHCRLSEINQVVLNILVNAAHAIGDIEKVRCGRGTITVKTYTEGEEVVISIADTGGGIPEEIRARVFDPFFTTKEIGRGTGQGLAIAQNMVVNRHGGRLTFETAMGKGTTFFVRLPVAGKPAAA